MKYHFNTTTRVIDGYPCRKDIFSSIKPIDITGQKQCVFFPIDCIQIKCNKVYGETIKGYSLMITGVLAGGQRVQVVVSEIPMYFDVRLPKENKDGFKKLVNDLIIGKDGKTLKEIASKRGIVNAFPGAGFEEERVTYLRFEFYNQWIRKNALEVVKKQRFQTANDIESPGDLMLSIANENNWSLADWSVVSNYKCRYVADYDTYVLFINKVTDLVAVQKPISVEPPLNVEVPKQPLYIICGYDIETNGLSTAVPSVDNLGEKIFMLSFGIYRSDEPNVPVYSGTITDQVYMAEAYDKHQSEINWDLILCENESDLILAFGAVLKAFYPEFRLAFNNFGFDDPYICKRIHQPHYNLFDDFADLCLPMEREVCLLSSKSAYEQILKEARIKLEGGVFQFATETRQMYIPGSINIDMMRALKKNNPKDDMLVSNGLRAYLERYNLPNKLDVTPEEMNKFYNSKDGFGMYETAKYCVVDALSCQRLQDKIALIAGYISLAQIAICTISDSFHRAGGMKVKNVIMCMGRRMSCIYTIHNDKAAHEGKYTGAIVFNPKRGRYAEVPTICVDFASLYPSVMRALHISAETYLEDAKVAASLKEKGYDVYDFNINWKGIDKTIYYVRKNPDGSDCRGVYPTCLEFLANIRKFYKKKKDVATDEIVRLEQEGVEYNDFRMKEARITEKAFDEKQKATKIVMNTIYGVIGSKEFILRNVDLALTITLVGQQCIKTASMVAERMGYERLYGDTDSCFLQPRIELLEGISEPRRKIEKCKELAATLLDAIHVEIRKITRRDKDIVKMELDKLMYPVVYLAKKKYYGMIYEGDKQPHAYVSGLQHIKRGCSQLLIELSEKVVNDTIQLDFDKDMLQFILEVLQLGVDIIKQKPFEYFIKHSKWKPGKSGTANLFIERMKKLAESDSSYDIPEPNVTFEYVVAAEIDTYTYNGRKRASKMTDKWEFPNIMKKHNRQIDYNYYLEDVIGSLARFVCFYPQFQPEDVDSITEEEADRKSLMNAEKYILEKLIDMTDGYRIQHTIIKKQRKVINAMFMERYENIFNKFIDAYDGNIGKDLLINFIIDRCKNPGDVVMTVPAKMTHEKAVAKRDEYIDKIRQNYDFIIKIYEDYCRLLVICSKDTIQEGYVKKLVEEINGDVSSDEISQKIANILSYMSKIVNYSYYSKKIPPKLVQPAAETSETVEPNADMKKIVPDWIDRIVSEFCGK